MDSVIVDCDSCQARPGACDTCVISVLLGEPDDLRRPELCEEEQRVLRLLADSGLLPPLRLVRAVAHRLPAEDGPDSERIARAAGG